MPTHLPHERDQVVDVAGRPSRRRDDEASAIGFLRHPAATRPDHVLAAQRLAGNAAVRRVLAPAHDAAGPPVPIQRGFFGKLGRTVKFYAGWPFSRVADAWRRLKAHRATAQDIAAVEDIMVQHGYQEMIAKKGWERDDAALRVAGDAINREAIARGLTINWG